MNPIESQGPTDQSPISMYKEENNLSNWSRHFHLKEEPQDEPICDR